MGDNNLNFGGQMNKASLIEALKDEVDIPKCEAQDIVNQFFNEMADTLTKGERVELRGLCSFHIREYRPYTGRNPKTGEITKVKPKKLPYFKCGKELRERINNKGGCELG